MYRIDKTNSKYNVEFHYKTFYVSDFDNLFNILEDNMEVNKITITATKPSVKIKFKEQKEFNNYNEMKNYLDSTQYEICEFETQIYYNEKHIFFYYDFICYKWILYYNEENLAIKGLIKELNKITTFNLVDIYKKNSWIINIFENYIILSIIIYGIIYEWYYSLILCVFLLLINYLNKKINRNHYKNKKTIIENKNEFVINIFINILVAGIFFLLGIYLG